MLALELGEFNVWTVTAWGLGVSAAMSFSGPAQQAVLSRIAGRQLQRAVTAATAINMFTYIVGLAAAGQLDRTGLRPVLLAQSLCLAAAALWIRRIGSHAAHDAEPGQPAWRRILEGFRASHRQRAVFDGMIVNFVSAIFNAGGFLTAFPFIVFQVYDGDTALLSWLMIVFFAGAGVSNLIMFRFMPLARPGRWFILFQLSRVVVLFLIWIEPAWWLVVTAVIAWGFNMGVTTTLARAIVQEAAEPQTRGRVMSVFGLGLLGAPLIGAVILGKIVAEYGPLAGLVPGHGGVCPAVRLQHDRDGPLAVSEPRSAIVRLDEDGQQPRRLFRRPCSRAAVAATGINHTWRAGRVRRPRGRRCQMPAPSSHCSTPPASPNPGNKGNRGATGRMPGGMHVRMNQEPLRVRVKSSGSCRRSPVGR